MAELFQESPASGCQSKVGRSGTPRSRFYCGTKVKVTTAFSPWETYTQLSRFAETLPLGQIRSNIPCWDTWARKRSNFTECGWGVSFLLFGRLPPPFPFSKPLKDKTVALSHRPIALTSCICKLFENMVNVWLVHFLERGGLLSPGLNFANTFWTQMGKSLSKVSWESRY